MYDTVIVRYGEIFLKSGYVKRRFEDILVANIRKRLDSLSLEGEVYRVRNRIYVKTREAEIVCSALSSVFGVVSVSPAVEVEADLEKISSLCVSLAKKVVSAGESFAVRVQRSGSHSFSSLDVERLCGEKIVEAMNLRVDLSSPDKTIFVEVRDDVAYVFDRKIPGPGGMPYGSQGKLVCLLSSGIDSPVAAYMMMRRGCVVSFVHFGEREDVCGVVGKLKSYVDGEIKLYVVPHKPFLEKIAAAADKYTCVLCKRFMYKVAERVAVFEGAYGIVTGENIGQVASQTLENLKVIDCISLPVYRPLIGFDKEDIISYARKIGTFGFAKTSIKCPFVPRRPATKSDLEKVLAAEEEACLADLLEDVEKNYVFGGR